MYGTGPVAQAAAYHAAGVGLRAVAPLVGVRVDQIGALLLGFWLHEARDQNPSLELVSEPGVCRIGGCGRPVLHLRLCEPHVYRFYSGRPLLGGGRIAPSRGRRIRVERCVVCGAAWCRLRLDQGPRRTCGDPACLRAAMGPRPDAARRARDEAIMARVRSGEQYRDIAVAFGLSEPRIGQMARRAGIRRYRQRSDAGRRTGPRRR